MRIALSPQNPFGYTPKGIAFELIRTNKHQGVHLDYGTYNGDFVAELSRAGLVGEAIGVDVNAEVVERNLSRMPTNARLEVIVKNAPLPFAPQSLDSISILGVIEHVHEQTRLLRQLATALRDDGIMVIAVPGVHALSFLDMGNFKFRFPWLHRKIYSWCYSPEDYTHRYVECRNGLFGDIEVEKMWHEHFSVASMTRLLETAGLQIVSNDGLGYFQRAIADIAFFCGGRRGLLKRIHDWDARVFHRTELVFLVKKM